jgi:hypothetical protein
MRSETISVRTGSQDVVHDLTRGFQIPQPIPEDVWDAYLELVRAGFDKYLLKSA